MNALLFPTHLMCTMHSISERLRTYNVFVVSARFCEIYFILQVLLYTFKGKLEYNMILTETDLKSLINSLYH